MQLIVHAFAPRTAVPADRPSMDRTSCPASRPSPAAFGASGVRTGTIPLRPSQVPVRVSTDQAEREAGQAATRRGAARLSPLRAAETDAAQARTRVPVSAGETLDSATQQAMTSGFSFDFSPVRIHSDREAAALAAGERARAYTVGHHVVFGADQYQPQSAAGQALLAHELGHVIQQSTAGVLAVQRDDLSGPGPAAPQQSFAPAEIVKRVIELANKYDPEASGGIGDFPAAFNLLSPLDTPTLILVLEQINKQAYLQVLKDHASAAGLDFPRMDAFILAVLYRASDLEDADRTRAHGLVNLLNPADRAALASYLAPLPEHRKELFLSGPDAEAKRLEDLQVKYWEDKRKAAEAAARAQAEKEAQAKGQPPPTTTPKVTTGEVVAKDVRAGALTPTPTATWDNLPAAAKDKLTKERAPAAFAKVLASIKGTELESVMKGRSLVFEPVLILRRGAYAYQAGSSLVCGVTFVEDAEKDPKNVWPLLAHEIGGHLAYGTTYASQFMARARDRLPEADRKQWTDTQEGRNRFFDAYEYNETEIFAALRQRRYDVPVTGPAPVHGAIKPDANIELRLSQMDTVFSKEVATAILDELNRKVQADVQILDRDKKFFLDQVKKHGYSL